MRYPTQIMSGVINLLVFVTLIVVERYGLRRARETGLEGERIWPFDGFVFLLYCNLFCVERFTMEFLRGDATPIIGLFSGTHFLTLAGWLVTGGLIAWKWRDRFTQHTRATIS